MGVVSMDHRSDAHGFHSILVAFLATLETSGECFELDEWEHSVGSPILQFSRVEHTLKQLCA